MISFIENVPIESVTGSQYNPRKITGEAIAELQASISKLGLIKPLIINKSNNTIIAGHQRKRAAVAAGLKFMPCIFVNSPAVQDEILFNLMHNSIETSISELKVSGFVAGKYKYIENSEISVLTKSPYLAEMSEISKLISRYGEWGSIVCDEDGNILLNSEYAYTAKQMGYGVLTYCIENNLKDTLLSYIQKDYGSYDFDNLNIKTYHQFLAQPKRLSSSGRKKNLSELYEKFIIPNITKQTRIIDIGAGRFKYVDMLSSKGYNILGYDPAFLKAGSNNIDIRSIIKHIKNIELSVKSDGLFDVCVLEAVINSVENDNFENIVLITCNSLLNQDGVLITCTRNIKEINKSTMKKKMSGDKSRRIYYLDSNNYTVGVSNGIAFKQKFHTADSYKSLLEKYFDDVQVVFEKSSYIYCVAKNPKQLKPESVEMALNEEFNIEYPNEYRHNKQGGLVSGILERLGDRHG